MGAVTLPEVICGVSLGSQGLTCFVLVDGFWNHNPLALPAWSEARRKHSDWSLFCAFAALASPCQDGGAVYVLSLSVLTKTMKGSWGLF